MNIYKKFTLVAVAALGVSLGVATTTNAKSSVKVINDSELTSVNAMRNMEANAKYSIRTKPEGVKGSKVVASKAKLKGLAKQHRSANYLRSYRFAETSNGEQYQKVVSMDGKYRGWINERGLNQVSTTHKVELNSEILNHSFYLKRESLWTAPSYTQYKAHPFKLNVKALSGTFKVIHAVRKTKEHTLYYYVESNEDKSYTGWVYAGAGQLKTASHDEDLGDLSTEPVAF